MNDTPGHFSCETPPVTNTQWPDERLGYPEPNQGATALVLAILSFVTLPLLAPFAWVLANRELQAIESGRRSPEGAGTARTARILAIIGTVVMFVVVILVIMIFTVGLGF